MDNQQKIRHLEKSGFDLEFVSKGEILYRPKAKCQIDSNRKHNKLNKK